jgi:hypothetical protein
MAKKGKNIRIPKLLALRTSLTLDETITLNRMLITNAMGTRRSNKMAIVQ